ncbi:MAG: anti-sigma factor domain-containing protein [Oscillochloridaceae bacterium umkhey_bin13]
MNDHHDDPANEPELAAYALGALDLSDRPAVEAQLAESPTHQEALRQLREVVALLPYATPALAPPDRVRSQLMARIAADQQAATPPPPQPSRTRRNWIQPLMFAALATLVLALTGLSVSLGQRIASLDQSNQALVATMAELQASLATTQERQEALAAQLTAGEARITQLSQQLANDGFVISFVSAPGVATRQLNPTNNVTNARGEMYMYPGESSAVVLFSGLPNLAPGQVYQFWLADGAHQTAAGTFVVDESGLARLLVEAPREVNAFLEVMVTIEPDGGSSTPSDEVVLAGSL